MADLGDVSKVMASKWPYHSMPNIPAENVSMAVAAQYPWHSMGVEIPGWPDVGKAVPRRIAGPAGAGGTPSSMQFG